METHVPCQCTLSNASQKIEHFAVKISNQNVAMDLLIHSFSKTSIIVEQIGSW